MGNKIKVLNSVYGVQSSLPERQEIKTYIFVSAKTDTRKHWGNKNMIKKNRVDRVKVGLKLFSVCLLYHIDFWTMYYNWLKEILKRKKKKKVFTNHNPVLSLITFLLVKLIYEYFWIKTQSWGPLDMFFFFSLYDRGCIFYWFCCRTVIAKLELHEMHASTPPQLNLFNGLK